jgi:hypothetical protein
MWTSSSADLQRISACVLPNSRNNKMSAHNLDFPSPCIMQSLGVYTVHFDLIIILSQLLQFISLCVLVIITRSIFQKSPELKEAHSVSFENFTL